MYKYNYVEIGERIRSEREKLNFSQDKLLDSIREKGKPCIGRNTLSKLENGEEKAFNAISLAQLTAMCEEFDCSISFLFGEYNYRNYDNKFVCEQTGLTENNLIRIMRNKNDFLNAIIGSQYFGNIDFGYDQMQDAINRANQCIHTARRLQKEYTALPADSPKRQEIDQAYYDTVSASEIWEGRIQYSIYKMGMDFGNAIEQIKNSIIEKAPSTIS